MGSRSEGGAELEIGSKSSRVHKQQDEHRDTTRGGAQVHQVSRSTGHGASVNGSLVD